MKSKVFRENSLITDQFGKDIREVIQAGIPEESLEDFSGMIAEWTFAPTKLDEAAVVEKIRSRWSVDGEKLGTIIKFGYFFLSELNEQDSAEDLLADIKELADLTDEETKRLEPILKSIVTIFRKRVVEKKRDLRAQHAGLRRLVMVRGTANLRIVTDDVGETHACEDTVGAGEIASRIRNLVPVGIIDMEFSDEETIVFQVDYRAIKRIQKELAELRDTLDAMIAYVGEDKVHKVRTE